MRIWDRNGVGEMEHWVPFRVVGPKEALCDWRTKQVRVGGAYSSLLSWTPSVHAWNAPPSLEGLKAVNA